MNKNRVVPIVVFLIGAAVVGGLFWFQNHAAYDPSKPFEQQFLINNDYNQYIVVNAMALLWVPMLSILLLFREEPSKFGFALGNWRKMWPILVIGFVGLATVMLYVSHWQAFQNYYPVFRHYRFPVSFEGVFSGDPWQAAPWLMIYAEASYGLYMFCWEFFFRGYLLFGLHRSVGWWAVLIQALAFGLLHFGKPMPEVISSFGAGIILGIIALNAKSFVPCFVLHWAVSLTFDVMIIAARFSR